MIQSASNPLDRFNHVGYPTIRLIHQRVDSNILYELSKIFRSKVERIKNYLQLVKDRHYSKTCRSVFGDIPLIRC